MKPWQARASLGRCGLRLLHRRAGPGARRELSSDELLKAFGARGLLLSRPGLRGCGRPRVPCAAFFLELPKDSSTPHLNPASLGHSRFLQVRSSHLNRLSVQPGQSPCSVNLQDLCWRLACGAETCVELFRVRGTASHLRQRKAAESLKPEAGRGLLGLAAAAAVGGRGMVTDLEAMRCFLWLQSSQRSSSPERCLRSAVQKHQRGYLRDTCVLFCTAQRSFVWRHTCRHSCYEGLCSQFETASEASTELGSGQTLVWKVR